MGKEQEEIDKKQATIGKKSQHSFQTILPFIALAAASLFELCMYIS
jgi:hypothetical protein